MIIRGGYCENVHRRLHPGKPQHRRLARRQGGGSAGASKRAGAPRSGPAGLQQAGAGHASATPPPPPRAACPCGPPPPAPAAAAPWPCPCTASRAAEGAVGTGGTAGEHERERRWAGWPPHECRLGWVLHTAAAGTCAGGGRRPHTSAGPRCAHLGGAVPPGLADLGGDLAPAQLGLLTLHLQGGWTRDAGSRHVDVGEHGRQWRVSMAASTEAQQAVAGSAAPVRHSMRHSSGRGAAAPACACPGRTASARAGSRRRGRGLRCWRRRRRRRRPAAPSWRRWAGPHGLRGRAWCPPARWRWTGPPGRRRRAWRPPAPLRRRQAPPGRWRRGRRAAQPGAQWASPAWADPHGPPTSLQAGGQAAVSWLGAAHERSCGRPRRACCCQPVLHSPWAMTTSPTLVV